MSTPTRVPSLHPHQCRQRLAARRIVYRRRPRMYAPRGRRVQPWAWVMVSAMA
jgi:hypothetical protein